MKRLPYFSSLDLSIRDGTAMPLLFQTSNPEKMTPASYIQNANETREEKGMVDKLDQSVVLIFFNLMD